MEYIFWFGHVSTSGLRSGETNNIQTITPCTCALYCMCISLKMFLGKTLKSLCNHLINSVVMLLLSASCMATNSDGQWAIDVLGSNTSCRQGTGQEHFVKFVLNSSKSEKKMN